MKLISLHIDAFGRLRDFDLDLNDGITELLHENGYGKTTVAAFIKAMLYGIPDNRDKGKVRKKYAPWSGGDFGGTLDLETERGKYRISRRFTPKTGDTFELFSLKTGMPSDDYSENIGFELFSVDSESYEKCAYLPQHEVDIKITDSISSRLEALLLGSAGTEGISVSDAIERIKSRRRELSLYRGEGGEIEKDRNALAACEERISELEHKAREAETAKNDATELEKRVKVYEKERSELEAKRKEEEKNKLIRKDHDIYQGYLGDCEKRRRELEALEKNFGNGVPSAQELERAATLEAQISAARRNRAAELNDTDDSEYRALSKKFGDTPPSTFELTERSLDIRELRRKREELAAANDEPEVKAAPSKNKALMLIGALLLSVGVVFAVVGAVNAPMLIALGAPLLILGAVLFIVGLPKKARETGESVTSDEKQRLYDAIAELENKLSEFFEKYGMDPEAHSFEVLLERLSADITRYKDMGDAANRRMRELLRIDGEIEKDEAELSEFLKKYGFFGENEKTAAEISGMILRLGTRREELFAAEKRAIEFKAGHDLSSEPPRAEHEEGELESLISGLDLRIRKEGGDAARLRERAVGYERETEQIPELKDKREMLSARIAENKERVSIYDETEKFLKKAEESLSSRHIDNMKNSFAERFSAITESDREVLVSAKLEVKLRDEGGAKSADSYSTGWQAVIAICQRLALVDSLYSAERPFLILDDPFVNLDGEKLERSKNILRELANDTQIIYLTCHESRSIK